MLDGSVLLPPVAKQPSPIDSDEYAREAEPGEGVSQVIIGKGRMQPAGPRQAPGRVRAFQFEIKGRNAEAMAIAIAVESRENQMLRVGSPAGVNMPGGSGQRSTPTMLIGPATAPSGRAARSRLPSGTKPRLTITRAPPASRAGINTQ